jgi:hypothetical protein
MPAPMARAIVRESELGSTDPGDNRKRSNRGVTKIPSSEKSRLQAGQAFKLSCLAIIITCAIWLMWDYTLTLIVWGHAPGYWYHGSWISMPVVYAMCQFPAMLAVGLYQIALGRFHSPSMTLLALPCVSAASLILTAAATDFNFDQPFYALAFWLLPRTAVYGLVYAILRKRVLTITPAASAA